MSAAEDYRERETRALDWVRVHCEPAPLGDSWVWPSGYRHTEQQSVKIAMTCQSLGIEPSDFVSIELMHSLMERVLQVEASLRELGSSAKLAKSAVAQLAATSPGRPV